MKKSNYLFALALGASTLTYAQVGIGTSSPSNPLDIEATNAALDINNSDSSDDPKINFQLSGTTNFSIGVDNADSKFKIGTTAPATSTAVTVQSTGEVGIGTTSPTAKFEVDGSAIFNESGAVVDFRVEGDTEANLLFVDGSSDAVGIGTSSPNGILHVHTDLSYAGGLEELLVDGGAPHVTIKDLNGSTGPSGQLLFTDESDVNLGGIGWGDLGGVTDNGYLRFESVSDDIRMVTSSGDVLSVTTTGRVGIGNTSPATTLDISGAVLAKGSISASSEALLELKAPYSQLQLTDTDDASYFHLSQSGGKLAFRANSTSATPLLYLDGSSSEVGIGTLDPNFKLDVRGTIGNNATTHHSDRRWKKNIDSIENPLQRILMVEGKKYEWRIDEFKEMNFPEGEHYGVIAQQIEGIFPNLVLTGANGYKSVDYGHMTPILIEAIKEQQAIIEAQKKEIETQKAELDTNTSTSKINAEEIEALKAQVQQLLQLIQQQESVSVVK